MFGISPVEIYTGKFDLFPILSYVVVCLEDFTQVVDMALDNVFYTKISNNEDKDDGEQFLVPKSRGGGVLVLP